MPGPDPGLMMFAVSMYTNFLCAQQVLLACINLWCDGTAFSWDAVSNCSGVGSVM